MGVGTVLTVLVLFIASADAAKGEVKFWKTDVTLTCPLEEVTWFFDDKAISNQSNTKTYTFPYDNGKKGPYHCQSTEGTNQKKYFFYVQGKVCEHCYELDANVFLFVIAGDLIFTVGMMFIIYTCTEKKSFDESSHESRSRGGGPPPPVPNPDYERLNPRTQNQDLYSRLAVTG